MAADAARGSPGDDRRGAGRRAGCPLTGPGRPRDAHADAAIEGAVRSLLAEHGWAGTSMQRVADRAGVARATVYRRAPDKASLVFAVLFGTDPAELSPSGRTWRGRLRALLAQLSAQFADPVGRAAMPGLFAEFARRPELADRVRSEMLAPAYEACERIVAEGRAAGEVTDGFDPTLLVDMLFGAVFVRALVVDRPVSPDVTADLLALALDGIVRRREPADGRARGHTVP